MKEPHLKFGYVPFGLWVLGCLGSLACSSSHRYMKKSSVTDEWCKKENLAPIPCGLLKFSDSIRWDRFIIVEVTEDGNTFVYRGDAEKGQSVPVWQAGEQVSKIVRRKDGIWIIPASDDVRWEWVRAAYHSVTDQKLKNHVELDL